MHRDRNALVALSLTAALALATAGCGRLFTPVPRTRTVRLAGTVRAADGSVPEPVHVAVSEIVGRKPLAAEPGDGGTFTAEIPVYEPVFLTVAAPYHEEARVPAVFRTADGDATVTVTLRPRRLREALEEVRVVGAFNGFDPDTAEPMERRDDGTWYWRREGVTTDPFRYQLLGVAADGRPVSGTQADELAYDGAGGFQSLVHPRDGVVEIVFDPRRLPGGPGDDLPAVRWDPAHAELAGCFEVMRTHDEAREAWWAEYERRRRAGDTEGKVELDTSPHRGRLRRIARRWEHPLVTELAALTEAMLEPYDPDARDPEGVMALLERVPPRSLAWGFHPFAFGTRVITPLEPDRGVYPIIRRFRFESRVPSLRLRCLSYEVGAAKYFGDEPRWRRLYAVLKREAGDDPLWRHDLVELDPDGRILAGKPVPHFEVTLLDGTRLTDTDLRGRYTLLDFWATWCGPCRAELPHLEAAWERYGGRGLEIVSLSFDESAEAIAAFRKEHPMPWRHALVEGGFRSELARTFQVMGIPKPILVGPDGTIAATVERLRGKELLATLAKLLGERAEPAPRNRAGTGS